MCFWHYKLHLWDISTQRGNSQHLPFTCYFIQRPLFTFEISSHLLNTRKRLFSGSSTITPLLSPLPNHLFWYYHAFLMGKCVFIWGVFNLCVLKLGSFKSILSVCSIEGGQVLLVRLKCKASER